MPGPTNPLTHDALNERLRAVGSAIAKRTQEPPNVFSVVNPTGHSDARLDKVVDRILLHGDFDDFETKYRRVFDKQDELVSTSSVRELLAGVIEEHKKNPLSSGRMKQVRDIFRQISRVRIATIHSGLATKKRRMQHPTSRPKAHFADPYDTMSEHAALDIERKSEVTTAMENALKDPKVDAYTVALAGLQRGMAYTLNDFTAPITAQDVRPYALRGGAPMSVLHAQANARESIKDTFADIGGDQEPGTQTYADNWAQRPGKKLRSVSPPRK
ncbi:hypothetical protein [Cupriavidus sp. CP313]